MPNSRSGPSRRSFLTSTAIATAAVGGKPLLSACGGEGSRGQEGRVSEDELRSLLPTYRPSDAAVEPDIASEHGSGPGYTRWIPDDELGVSVPEPRGGGARLRAMTPLWGTPPRAGNPFWTAMDEGSGVRVDGQIQHGNTYGDKLAATLASSDVPDLVCIPEWNLTGQIPQGIASRFADLGPFLSGDRVLDYPNLAAIPTEAWGPSVFGGALRGLPLPANPLDTVAPFYRQDIFDANGWTPPTSAREFLDFARDVTSPRDRVWACEDMKWFGGIMDGSPQWELVNGRLVNRRETELYLEALEWNRGLFEARVVHPDAIGTTGAPRVRFTAGEVLMCIQGPGSWYPIAVEQQRSNPDFRMNAFDFFAPGRRRPRAVPGKRLGHLDVRQQEPLRGPHPGGAGAGQLRRRPVRHGGAAAEAVRYRGHPLHPGGRAAGPHRPGHRRGRPGDPPLHPPAADLHRLPRPAAGRRGLHRLAAAELRLRRGLDLRRPADPGARPAVRHLGQLRRPGGRHVPRPGLDPRRRNAVDEWRRTGGDELRDFYQRLLDEEGGAA